MRLPLFYCFKSVSFMMMMMMIIVIVIIALIIALIIISLFFSRAPTLHISSVYLSLLAHPRIRNLCTICGVRWAALCWVFLLPALGSWELT